MDKKNKPKDVFINGTRIYVDKNGKVRTRLSKEIRHRGGLMTLEEFRAILLAEIKMIYEL